MVRQVLGKPTEKLLKHLTWCTFFTKTRPKLFFVCECVCHMRSILMGTLVASCQCSECLHEDAPSLRDNQKALCGVVSCTCGQRWLRWRVQTRVKDKLTKEKTVSKSFQIQIPKAFKEKYTWEASDFPWKRRKIEQSYRRFRLLCLFDGTCRP